MSKRSSLLGIRESEPSSQERGTAFIEFAISLPFLVTLIIGVIDIGRGMREYFVMKAAVIEGADRAMSLANLQGSGSSCPGTANASHKQVHQRVSGLLQLQSHGLRDTCVSSEVITASGTTKDNTVSVQASASFVALFPLFDGVPIAAEARMPYLRAP